MNGAILITGGLGYVGGRIARALAEETDFTLLLGTRNPALPKPAWLKEGSVVPLDVTSERALPDLGKKVRFVLHLAAMNEIESARDPAAAVTVNTLGTLKLVQAAERAGVERFVYFSTAHVYGAPLAGTISEATLARPVHPYAITHRAAEDFVLAAHDRKAMGGLVLRLSNAFGAPIGPEVNRWTLLVNDLCRQAVATRKMVLQSAGLQKRDFVTLSDVARAVLHCLGLEPGPCGNGLFNLGGDKAMSILEMTRLVRSEEETSELQSR